MCSCVAVTRVKTVFRFAFRGIMSNNILRQLGVTE